ncbi:hypothetical protein [Aliikangiella maris]|uniref:Uncharacterized protein n=2 Tax=Aliikangiella maris TaxID=3162458 RepID=A0ABV2BZR9_9GAMM
MPASEGDAEVYLAEENEWARIYRFNEAISFNATETWDEPEDELRAITFALAKKLDAQVNGDEGETYNEDGSSNWKDMRPAQPVKVNLMPAKKWWQFWK